MEERGLNMSGLFSIRRIELIAAPILINNLIGNDNVMHIMGIFTTVIRKCSDLILFTDDKTLFLNWNYNIVSIK